MIGRGDIMGRIQKIAKRIYADSNYSQIFNKIQPVLYDCGIVYDWKEIELRTESLDSYGKIYKLEENIKKLNQLKDATEYVLNELSKEKLIENISCDYRIFSEVNHCVIIYFDFSEEYRKRIAENYLKNIQNNNSDEIDEKAVQKAGKDMEFEMELLIKEIKDSALVNKEYLEFIG